MKQLAIFALSLLLITGASQSLARGKHHGGGWDSHHGQYYSPRRHHRYYYKPHYRRNYYQGYRHYRPYRQDYYGSYLGAALLGSALTSGLHHNHNGNSCYQDHSNGRNTSLENREVIGCHRIERLPDGTERRVEVPMSQCQ